MSVGGKGLLWCNEKLAKPKRVVVVISSNEDEGEKRQDKEPPAPRSSLRLLGVKRKNYIEHTPEPKDYAKGSDWESIMSPGSWGATGRDYDDDWPGWAEEERKEEDDPSGGDSGKKKKDDDNFLVRNIRKLFGMVGDLQKQGGGRPRCNCSRCH